MVLEPALFPEARGKTGAAVMEGEGIVGHVLEPLVGDMGAGSEEDCRAEEEMDNGTLPVTTPPAASPSVPSFSEEEGSAAMEHATEAEEGAGEEPELLPMVKVIEKECQMDTLPSIPLDNSNAAMDVQKDTQMSEEAGKEIQSQEVEMVKQMESEKGHVSSVDTGESSEQMCLFLTRALNRGCQSSILQVEP